jgi:hypothetical protein
LSSVEWQPSNWPQQGAEVPWVSSLCIMPVTATGCQSQPVFIGVGFLRKGWAFSDSLSSSCRSPPGVGVVFYEVRESEWVYVCVCVCECVWESLCMVRERVCVYQISSIQNGISLDAVSVSYLAGPLYTWQKSLWKQIRGFPFSYSTAFTPAISFHRNSSWKPSFKNLQ